MKESISSCCRLAAAGRVATVYVLLTKPKLVDNAAAGPGSTAPEAVLKLGDLDVLSEVRIGICMVHRLIKS